MKRSMQTKMAKLQKMFPQVWMKDGADFDASYKNTIWTGEGSSVMDNGVEMYAFNYDIYFNTDGEHPAIRKALDALGLYAQFYDGGTVFIYEQ